eukprot:Polyplicarium_translucidae@DN3070_c0_g1_i4.p1
MLSTAPALLADAEGAGNVALAEVSFFCFCFLSAAALQWIVSKIPAYAPPVSIVWFVYGLLAQLVVHYVESNTFLAAGIDTMARIDSNIPYYVLLPILLYEATQNINWHKFRRFLLSGLALAVLGVAFQVVIIGSLLALSFSMKWIQSYLIASTLGSTDPVAVISVLNNLQAPEVGPESTIFGKWVPWGRKRQPSGADGGAQNLTGFEVEWNVLRSRLSCLRLSWLKRVPSRFLRALLTFPAVVTDLQQVVAFVDVHEELLLKGGDSLQQL